MEHIKSTPMEKDTRSKNVEDVTHIEIIWDDKKDLVELSSTPTFSHFVLKKTYKSIKKAIKLNLEIVELFNIFNLSIIVELKRSNFHLVLEKIKDMYVIEEDYEECEKIKKLIKKL